MSEPDTASLNLLWADQLMDGLAAAGVTRLVFSPGSRSTPLVLAAERHPRLRLWRHPDERSAAFFALGLAGHAGEPVAVLATSGSAPGHWLPAVIEANRAGLPLILLSADRPDEQQACGANQTVDQIHLFGQQVRAFHSAGTPGAEASRLAYIRRLGIQAVHRACGADPGPVHINLPFREPLTPRLLPPAPRPGSAVMPARQRSSPDPQQLQRMREILSHGRGLIVCGPMRPEADLPAALARLARRLDCPLLADPLSGLRFGEHDHARIISRYDGFLLTHSFHQGPGPAWVLRFGAAPISRALLDYLQRSRAVHILCAPRGDWPDPLHRTVEMVRSDPGLLCEALDTSELPAGEPQWSEVFQRAERCVAEFQPPPQELPCEDQLIGELLDTLPAGALLFSGNSLPIRQLDSWSGQGAKPLRILANRGASGIDGNVSTLLGLAAAGDRPVVGLLGDLTFFHDMNGLLFARGLRGVIVLLNNDGGGIFGTLPQAGLAEFEPDWLMPTHLDFSHSARLYGLAYRRIEQQAQFRPALEQALAGEGVSLLEVMLQRQACLQRQQDLQAQLQTLVEQLPLHLPAK